MERPKLTRESRCLVIVAGGVLERCIENRARAIAASRSADMIIREDVEAAAADFFADGLSDLPHLVQRAMSEFQYPSSKAA